MTMSFLINFALMAMPLYLISYILRSIIGLVIHVRQAQKTGLPYIIFPACEWNILLILLFSSRPVTYAVNNWLPGWVADRLKSNAGRHRWALRDREVRRRGGCYLRASPGELVCDVSDAKSACYLFSSRGEFPKASWQYELLNIYGVNIVGASDADWPHHRRYSAPAFNEKNNALVWKEAILQGGQMLDHWRGTTSPEPTSNFVVFSPKSDILKLALQILASAGYGVRLPFIPRTDTSEGDATSIYADSPYPPPGYHFTLRSVSEYMSEHIYSVLIANVIIPQWVPRHLIPFFQNRTNAYNDLRKYLQSLIQVAKSDGYAGQASNNLLHLMLRSSSEGKSSSDLSPGLTSEELMGNLHIFTIAGHETTATTLRFTLLLLALHPQAQKWMRQGIKDELRGQPDNPQSWNYSEIFPKLVTPLCVMMETLRLFPPVVTIPKWTNSHSAKLVHNDQAYILPPNTNININTTGLHYSTDYWGPDAACFKPERWDARNKDSYLALNEGIEGLSSPGLEHSTLHKPIRGAYIPFSDGIRSCLGKRFAQVEYVAIVTILFRDYEVSLGRRPGQENVSETELISQAQKALDGSVTSLILSMPDDVALSFKCL